MDQAVVARQTPKKDPEHIRTLERTMRAICEWILEFMRGLSPSASSQGSLRRSWHAVRSPGGGGGRLRRS